jgi:hypothetical protein
VVDFMENFMEKLYIVHFKLDNQKRWIEMSGKNLQDVKSRFNRQSFDHTGQLTEIVAIYPL